MRHSIFNKAGDAQQRKQMKEEIEGYMQQVQRQEHEALLKDVYVTDHKPK
jgi:hypothetical protein